MFFVGLVLAVAFAAWQVRDMPIDRIVRGLEKDGFVLICVRALFTWGFGVFTAYALLPFSRWYVGKTRSIEPYLTRDTGDGRAPLHTRDIPAIDGDAPTTPYARQVRTVRFTNRKFVLETLAFDSSLMSQVRLVPDCTYDAANRSHSLPATAEAAAALGALSADVELFWTPEAIEWANEVATNPDDPTSDSRPRARDGPTPD